MRKAKRNQLLLGFIAAQGMGGFVALLPPEDKSDQWCAQVCNRLGEPTGPRGAGATPDEAIDALVAYNM